MKQKQLLNEIHTLSEIISKYPTSYFNYTPQIFDMYQDNKQNQYNVFIIMANMDTDLNYYMTENRDKVSLEIMYSMINKLKYIYNFLKKIGIVHNEIKPENFVLENHNPEDSLKIIDFGCVSYENSDIKPTCLSKHYASPELFVTRSPEASDQEYNVAITTKSDLWSIGMVIYYLFNKGGKNFFTHSPNYLDDFIVRLENWKIGEDGMWDTIDGKLSEDQIYLLNNFIQFDPNERNFI